MTVFRCPLSRRDLQFVRGKIKSGLVSLLLASTLELGRRSHAHSYEYSCRISRLFLVARAVRTVGLSAGHSQLYRI
jgi:hypothetical protein